MIRISLEEKCRASQEQWTPETFLEEYWNELDAKRASTKLTWSGTTKPIGTLSQAVAQALTLSETDPLRCFFEAVAEVLAADPTASLAKKIVLALPETLVDLVGSDALKDLQAQPNPNRVPAGEEKATSPATVGDWVKAVFSYDRFGNAIGNQFKQLPWSVCPYCGCNLIQQFEADPSKPDSTKRSWQLDHFFDKATHPLLALSFYNLVPSCSFCNSTALKGNNPIGTVSPWRTDYGFHALFRFGLRTCPDYAPTLPPWLQDLESKLPGGAVPTGKGLEIALEKPKTWRERAETLFPDMDMADLDRIEAQEADLEELINVLQLRRRYQLFDGQINRLAAKRLRYPDSLLEELASVANLSLEEMKRRLFEPKYHDTTSDHLPLSKLSYDIHQELGIEAEKDDFYGIN